MEAWSLRKLRIFLFSSNDLDNFQLLGYKGVVRTIRNGFTILVSPLNFIYGDNGDRSTDQQSQAYAKTQLHSLLRSHRLLLVSGLLLRNC